MVIRFSEGYEYSDEWSGDSKRCDSHVSYETVAGLLDVSGLRLTWS